MRPLPWSFSALDTFITCPAMYEAQYVSKSVKREDGPELVWGNRVHKAFELRQADHTKLPDEMIAHEPYMARLDAVSGVLAAEQRVALNKQARPSGFFAGDVWWRGVIDWKKVDLGARRAKLVDYKTGKKHDKFKQLAVFALHTFANDEVDLVDAEFYWTATADTTRKVWGRAEIPQLWALFIPDLKQYKAAFETNTWQERPNGLCNGWCPKTTCQFWKPKRPRR
jgi:hypothetical protein